MKRRYFVWLFLFFLSGCTAIRSKPGGRHSRAGSRPEKLRFAVTDRKGLELLQRDYEPFRKALEEVLEKKIEFFPTENYIAAASALELDRVDIVLAGPSEYAVIRARTNASPALAITRPNFHSGIAVRADSGIKSVAQLKGKTIALGEVGGTASHIAPIKFLIDAGLNPQSDVKIRMVGTEEKKGLEELKAGAVDAWGGSVQRYEKFLQAEGVAESAYPLIVEGPPLPGDVFVANSKLDSAFVEEMRTRLLENQDKLLRAIRAPEANEKYSSSQLVPARDDDYNMIREVYKAIGQGDFIDGSGPSQTSRF
ncbi:MAG: PhnD/SsuA/transferrin family substrate-binding protein [Oscillatoria princeps RMCB-10]|jgi:phosphonate transport system substrate-binding protein|nr:PhnD/SsuA/transferrin family substrate-binding protein [Oscillatoria princeps RMCB-10]